MPVLGGQDSHLPISQLSYLSAAAALGTLSALCSTGKRRGLARSSGLSLWAESTGRAMVSLAQLLGRQQTAPSRQGPSSLLVSVCLPL